MAKNSYNDPHECILWDGHLNYNNYPFIYRKGRPVLYHRLIAQEKYDSGPLPREIEVGHYCGVNSCVNPEHLFAGTRAARRVVNAALGRKDGGPKLRTHCMKGHKYTAANIIYKKKKNGTKQRVCKACAMHHTRMHQRKRRGFYYGGKAFEKECKNGHTRTEENTYIEKNGSKRCLECRRINTLRNRDTFNARRRERRRHAKRARTDSST